MNRNSIESRPLATHSEPKNRQTRARAVRNLANVLKDSGMSTLHQWQLVCDIALALSLLVAAIRFARQNTDSSTQQTRALEESLRRLLDEADTASRSLATELTRRQNSLERLLLDLESGEARISRALTSVDVAAETLASQEVRAAAKQPRPLVRQIEIETEPVEPVRLSREIVEVPSLAADSGTATGGLNIFGEPIQAPPPKPTKTARSYSASTKATEPIREDIEEIYNAAEAMLRAGKDLNEIQRTTRIPRADLDMLSEVVQREMRMEKRSSTGKQKNEAPSDPRLGVLSAAGIRREVQTL